MHKCSRPDIYFTSFGTQRCPGYNKILRRLPALEGFYQETKLKLTYSLLNLESQNQAKNIPVALLSFPIKFVENRSRG